jgi:hypothetical protein
MLWLNSATTIGLPVDGVVGVFSPLSWKANELSPKRDALKPTDATKRCPPQPDYIPTLFAYA